MPADERNESKPVPPKGLTCAETRRDGAAALRCVLLDLINDPVVCHTMDGRILFANEAACQGRGYTRDDLIGGNLSKILSESAESRRAERAERLLAEGSLVFESEDVTRGGAAIPVEVHARVASVDGETVIVSVIRDIRERKRAQAEIVSLAFHDTLTGLPNRRMFMDRLSIALSNARRTGENVALLFLDLDYLKRVNDRLGHCAGDRLLSLLGARLSSTVRTADTVARIGGDEYVVLMPGIRDMAAVEECASKILTAIREPFEIGDRTVYITASIGVAINDPREIGAEELLSSADTAMYRVKSASRDAYAIHLLDRVPSVPDGFDLGRELLSALESGQFSLHYQPQVKLESGAVECVEALLRWDHPVHGLLYPERFIPVAEEVGAFEILGSWALREACGQIRSWTEEGVSDIRVAVNVAYSQLIQPRFVDFVVGLIAEHGIEPSQIELEVDERELVWANESVRRSLARLHEAGVRLAVSGFAWGYRVSRHVHGVAFDTLKVRVCPEGARDESTPDAGVCSAVLSLASALELDTVVECVEENTQLANVARELCGRVQGYVFSHALPADEVLPKLKEGFPSG